MNSAIDNHLTKTFRGGLVLATIAAVVLSAAFAVSAFGQESTGNSSEGVNAAAAKKTKVPEQTNAASPLGPSSSNNYVFTTTTSGTFTDMSSGTTQLVGPSADDASSVVTNIGFDFYLLGIRYTQFSASSNGFVRLGSTAIGSTTFDLGTAGETLIAAYGSDLMTSTASGKIHFKVTGSAPNRVLTIEFLDETIVLDGGAGATADGTYQIRLYETTGVVEFVYGQMNRNSSVLDPQWVGFSTNNTDNTYVTVTTATNVANTTGGPVSNNPPASAPIANLNTPVEGSRRTYSFTPATPTAPTNLTFSGVTALAMTLNWTDSPDESLYAVYRSTDGVNYNFETTLAQNTTSYPVSGLTPTTTYFWQVFAVSDGAFSTALSGSQATSAPGSISATLVGGNWSAPATWVGGIVPTSSDIVTIADGATVTIDTAAVAFSLNVGQGASGVLVWDTAAAHTLTVGFDVTINPGAMFITGAAGAITTHVLSIGGNLTNNGTLDFSTTGVSANSNGAGITFTGASNNTFGGTGATTDIRTITLNKGTSNSNVLELNTPTFTVQGASVDSASANYLTLTNGTFKISGTFTAAFRTFSAAAYTIPATAGFWLNNPNYTVSAQAGSSNNNGLLRISQGTFNFGTVAGNVLGGAAGAAFTIEGGVMNIASRLNTASSVTYTQTGGTVNVNTVGNATALGASFGLTSGTSSFNMSGGTINLVQINSTGAAANRLDYQVSGTPNVTGGTLNVGTSATTGNAGNFDFRIRGQVPNLVLDNTSNNKNVLLTGQTNTFGNVTVNTGCTFSTQSSVWQVIGTTITNNGTITVPTNLGRLYFVGSGAQTYTGSGTATVATAAGAVDLTMDNPAGLTIDPSSNGIVTQRVIFLRGGITNSNKLTLGNGGATSELVQYGIASGTNTAGNFDVAPVFNLGTAGLSILYLQESSTRTTGVEIPSSRTILTTTINNTNGVILNGGDLSLTSVAASPNNALRLLAGRLITGANTVILPNAASTVFRTSGHVDGNLRKDYAATGSKVFEVGTANGYSPVTVNVTAGTLPANFTVKATQGSQPSVNPATSIQRYWTLTGSSITADLSFQYLAGDVMGNETNYRVIRVMGATPVSFPTSVVTPATHTATLAGVSTFSDWTVGEVTAPTAAPATIRGQVTAANGTPLPGVTMYLSGGTSARTITDSNGNYRFVNVDTDNFYTVTPSITNYHFSPSSLSFSLLADKTDAIFSGTRDDVTSGNVIDTPEYFVRQHYLDFLGREPDDAGLNFWSDQILGCGNDFNCVERRTINVSAAYFLSIEFRETGGLVDSLYHASYGRAPLFSEFMPDRAIIARDVIVNQTGWQDQLASNKQEFLDAWVQRPAFRAAYDNLANDGYVDTLISNTGINFTPDERAALVGGLNNNTLTRVGVLQQIAQDERFVKAKFNEAFVRMQYFGYLRRDPDESGFNFWLNKLNQFDGNFERADMVKSFLVSGEYRDRFRQ